MRLRSLALLLCALAAGAHTAGALRAGFAHRTAPPAWRARRVLASVQGPSGGRGDGGRLTIGGLAAAGALETGYLTATKLAGSAPAFCTNAGACKAVLEGPWSSVGGVPLSAAGLALYGTLCLAALAPLAARGRVSDDALRHMDVLSTVVLQLGSTAAAVFSAFLMLLLATTLHAPCVLCILSAAISTCLFAVTWNANIVPDRTAAVAYSASCAVLTSGFALGVYLLASGAPQMAGASVEESLPFRPPAIETSSSPEALRLSQRLGAQQARMFGAYWCSHCLDQKEAIGKEAMSHLPYVECAKDGADSQFPLCRQLDVPGYPTWEIGGRLFPGEKSVNELARLLDDKAYASSKQYVPGQPKQKS